jgi:hypothetical protein
MKALFSAMIVGYAIAASLRQRPPAVRPPRLIGAPAGVTLH